MTIRIKDIHYYVLSTVPGISGFQRWDERVETIVTGRKARLNRNNIDREYLAHGSGRFRVADGHLPESQPIMSEVDALRWLDANPYGGIVKVD